MKTALERGWAYLFCLILLFYAVPLLYFVDGFSQWMAALMLLLVNPLTCMVVNLIYGVKNGIRWLFLLAVPVLYLPSIFLYYNSTAWGYSVVYLLLGVVGMGIGALAGRPLRRRRQQ